MRTRLVVGVTVPFSLILFGHRLSTMCDNGWDVHVVVGESIPPDFTQDPRIVIHVLPMTRGISPFGDVVALIRWMRLLRSLSPMVVVGATPKAGLLSMLAARLCRVQHRVLEVWGARWDGRTGPQTDILRIADRVAARSANHVVACSQSVADLFVDTGVVRAAPILLGYGGTKGVDTSRFRYEQQHQGYQFDIGFVGRLAGDKGADQLLEVFTRIKVERPLAQLGLAGGMDTADPIDSQTREALTCDPNVTVLGYITDVETFLNGVRVLCFPSRREGLPNAIIEAAACGVPAVAWRVTGCIDAIIDGETGFLIPYGDIDQMTDRVREIVTNDKLRASMSTAAIRFAGDRFDSRVVEANYTNFYLKLAAHV